MGDSEINDYGFNPFDVTLSSQSSLAATENGSDNQLKKSLAVLLSQHFIILAVWVPI